jgi:lipopolysaccharide biosynthesis glycosyltransferase
MLNTTIKRIEGYVYSRVLRLVNVPKKLHKSDVCISSLTSHNDLLLLVSCLKSLFRQLGYQLPIYVYTDGSVTARDKRNLTGFRHVTIIDPKVADIQMKELLRKFPNMIKYRFDEENAITRRKFDAYLLPPHDRVLYLDSDLFFINHPKEVDSWIKNKVGIHLALGINSKMLAKVDLEWSFRELLNMRVTPLVSSAFNTGVVGVANKGEILSDKIEAILEILNQAHYTHTFTCDETIISAVLDRQNVKVLNHRKYMCFFKLNQLRDMLKKDALKNVVMLHYIRETKERYIRDAAMYFIHDFIRSRL